jgi:hypothetical protein
MNTTQERILSELNEQGISKTDVSELFSEHGKKYFNQTIDYFNDFLNNPNMQERCRRISEGNPIRDMSKWYELTVLENLGRGLGLSDGGVINMYLQPEITDIVTKFHGETPIIRNVLTWVHPQNALKSEIASQRWHRDQEDRKICKVFVYFSDVWESTGALKFVKHSQHGGKYQDIANNISDTGVVPPETTNWKFTPPAEDIVSAEGPAGTIYFVNTNGCHKGGLVDEGVRCLTQANFLTKNANIIKNGNNLRTFDYDSRVNILDTSSEEYNNLSQIQKEILS